jgi:hypothetical protein
VEGENLHYYLAQVAPRVLQKKSACEPVTGSTPFSFSSQEQESILPQRRHCGTTAGPLRIPARVPTSPGVWKDKAMEGVGSTWHSGGPTWTGYLNKQQYTRWLPKD